MSTRTNNGHTVRRFLQIMSLALTSRHGLTARDMAQHVHGRDTVTERQTATMRSWLYWMHEHGMLERDRESRAVLGSCRGGRELASTKPVYRYRVHPDLLMSVWTAHRDVFEELSRERRAG